MPCLMELWHYGVLPPGVWLYCLHLHLAGRTNIGGSCHAGFIGLSFLCNIRMSFYPLRRVNRGCRIYAWLPFKFLVTLDVLCAIFWVFLGSSVDKATHAALCTISEEFLQMVSKDCVRGLLLPDSLPFKGVLCNGWR